MLIVRAVRDETGVTLVEVLMTLVLTVGLMMFSLNLLATSSQSERRTSERTQTVAQVQLGVARLMRELHQAAAFNFLTSQIVDVSYWVRGGSPGNLRRVRYDCAQAAECRRYEGPIDQPLPATYEVLTKGVANPDVFTPEPNFLSPSWVGIRLRLDIEGANEPVTVTDGTSLPNLG